MKKYIYVISSLVIILLFTAPDLILLNSELIRPLPPNWDAANMQLWQYASMNGELIFKDFWFPYTESIRLIQNNLSGWLSLFIFKLILFLLFSFLLYELFDNKLFCFILLLFIILGSEVSLNSYPLFWSIDRYLLSISLVISFAISKNKFNFIGVIIFTLGIFTYQDQIIISILPILYILYWNLVEDKFNLIKFLKSRLDLACIAIILLLYLFKLFYYDQLSGFIYFYQNYGSMYSYAFSPEAVIDNLKNISSFDFIYIFTPIVTFLFIRDRNLRGQEALLCHSLAILTFLVTLKFLMRFTATQPLVFTILCVIFLVKYYLINYKNYPYILGITLACIIFSYGNSYFQVFKSLGGGFSRIVNSTNFLLSKTIVNEEFKITRFRNSKSELELVKKILEFSAINQVEPKIYFFGEPSVLYILLNQKIPYYTSLYDSSSIEAQLKLINWIDNSANILIIDEYFKKFDNLPNNLRSVKLINYLVNNFDIKEKIGNHYIAIKKNTSLNERHLDDWIKIFGNVLDVNKLYTPSSHPCPARSIDLFDPISTKNSKVIQFGQYQFEIFYSNSYKKLGHLCMPLNDLWFNN